LTEENKEENFGTFNFVTVARHSQKTQLKTCTKKSEKEEKP